MSRQTHFKRGLVKGAVHGYATQQMRKAKRKRNVPINKIANVMSVTPTIYGPFKPGLGEIKSVDTISPGDSVVLSTTGVFKLLNGVQEGSGFYNRVGRKIAMKSLHLTAYIAQNNANAAVTIEDYVRIIVVYDRQSNGAFPGQQDLLLNYDNAGTSYSSALAGINMNNRERFYVLADERILLNPVGINGATSTVGNTYPDPNNARTYNINRFIRLKGLESHYKASSNPAVVGDIATGALLLFAVTESTLVGNTAYNLEYTHRLKYVDV